MSAQIKVDTDRPAQMTFSSDTYLSSFLNWEQHLSRAGADAFTLDDFEKLLVLFGRPDDRLKFAHIAGTKGKGSTAAFLASILRCAGYRVGLYTSPHLHTVRERIRILEPGGTPAPFEGMISEEEFHDRLKYYSRPVDDFRNSGGRVTYYEILTALAVSWFDARKVQIVVLETGLGGRLDATNVFETSVCGITPVGLEHTRILGDTLSKITAEKAGIIKSPLQKVVLAPQLPEAMAVLEARCREFNITPAVVGGSLPLRVIDERRAGIDLEVSGRREYRGLHTGLLGRHQAVNAAAALGMAEELEIYGFLLTEEAVRQGISETVWPARMEVVNENPLTLIDCAHTPDSAKALAASFRALFPGQKAVLIFGASEDKDVALMFKELEPVALSVVLTRSANPRSMDFSKTGAAGFLKNTPSVVMPSAEAAVAEARRLAGDQGIILAAGSVFLSAEVRSLYFKKNY
jgi:dihydrofolate synthase/folylpolyglutamate synthase